LVCFARDGRRITAPTPSRSQTRGGGDFSFFSLTTAATSLPPPPLAGKRKVGVVLGSFCSRQLPHHHPHPLSLANARWGWFLVRFTRDHHHVITTTPPRLQTRVGGVSWFVLLVTAAASPLPPPLTRKCEVGVTFHSFHSRRLPRHCHHSLLLANARWGWSLVRFARNSCHITTPTPSCSQTRGGGRFLFFSLTTAPHHGHHPLSLTNARWGWFLVRFACDGRHVTTTTPSRSQTRVGGSPSLYLVVFRCIINYSIHTC
jgi:hypothetical protein